MRRLRRAAIGIAIGAAAIAASAGATAASPAHGGGVRLHEVGDFASPIDIVSAPGVSGFVYVVERAGRVIAVNGHHRHPFLNISKRTSTGGERGLLSIAFDPRFKRNRLLYAYYTNSKGNIEVDAFRAPSRRNARERSRRKVIVIPHPGESNHNGGQLQFGPDGLLYLGTGDGGGEGDPHGHGQSKRTLLGKLLRINPHRRDGKRYTIPSGNPFRHGRGRKEIYALGLRNPFRFSFDHKTGAIAIGDVGQDRWEEIDYVKRHKLRGSNFGWNHFEGRHVYDSSTPRPRHRYRPPIHEYSHSKGCAIIGGYVVRDRRLRSLRGRYVYTDLCNGQLRSLVPQRRHHRHDRSLGLHVSDPSSFGEAHGHVYVASLDGPVYRLVPKH